MTKGKRFVSGARPYKLTAEVTIIGSDLLVVISGGDRPHIGSVAVAMPRPSLQNRALMSATSSVYNLPGHKDQVIAQHVAEELSSKLNRTVVVTAGFHVDAISGKGIENVRANAARLAQRIQVSLKKTT